MSPTTGPAVVVRAYAKINLDLRVAHVRPDGYHDLRTVFQTIGLHDTLTCEPCVGPLRLASNLAGLPLDGSNLVWRAAEALWRASGRRGSPAGVRIRLRKRIPVAGGLGGGSADAAATLRALSQMWRVELSPGRVTEVAATLGADVPFFLSGGTALGLGRGDEIYPLVDLAPYWLVLLVPSFGVSSAEAFRWYDAAHAEGRLPAPAGPARLPGIHGDGECRLVNALEAPVATRHPPIRRMTRALVRAGAEAAAMSGSGSTVFGLFRTRTSAVRAGAALAGRGWQALVTRTLNRAAWTRGARPVARRAPR